MREAMKALEDGKYHRSSCVGFCCCNHFLHYSQNDGTWIHVYMDTYVGRYFGKYSVPTM